MVFEIVNKENKTDRISHNYQFDSSIPICRPVFLKLHGISKDTLLALQKHLKTDDLNKRVHGNTKRIPKISSRVFVDLDLAEMVKDFILQYSNIHGLPSPMKFRDESEPIIYLPTEENYTTQQYIINLKIIFILIMMNLTELFHIQHFTECGNN